MSRPAPAATLEVRRLTTADLDDILAIEESSFTVPWTRNTFESLLSRRDSDVLGALDPEGEISGYIVAWTIVDQAEIGNVAVAPEKRCRGAGRTLIREALARSAARGARECFLEVRVSNAGARKLYESFGFAVVGRRRRYYNSPVEDALIMRAAL
jgi:ribosomal-protein-alanine N-acetyltransferase